MHRIHLFLIVCLAGALGPLHAQNPGAAEYREFTAQSGKTVRARLMRVEDENAILRFSTGKETSVPIAALSEADQSYIENWNPRERLQAKAGEAAANFELAGLMEKLGYTSAGLEQEGKSIWIEVKIKDEPYRFIFDSGRALSMVDRSIADKFNAATDLDIAEFPAAGGGVEKVYIALLPLELGEVSIDEFEFGTVPLKKVGFDADGVIGADVITYFEGVVDWNSMKIYLDKDA